MTSITEAAHRPIGWLRSPRFDLGFIGLPAMISLASGLFVVANPWSFGWILALDLWLLGYHHVISTYTRLCFDRESFRQHRFLVLWLPLLVFATTLALALGIGFWVVGSLYLYWQWFHYTRQSWGLSQVYRRKEAELVTEGEYLSKLAFYLLPLWGILHRSWQSPETFLGLEVRVLPVPGWLVDIVAIAAIASLVLWALLRARAFQRGRGPVAHTLYMVTHFVIFAVGYLLIEDVTYGWLVINIWHNAQYVVFVWLYNTNRFRNGLDLKARFLSRISQARNWWLYFAISLAFTTLLYGAIFSSKDMLYSIGLPSLIIIFQTINFHHYIVDGIIWKARKTPMRTTLGLA
jgi:hypothetical protein